MTVRCAYAGFRAAAPLDPRLTFPFGLLTALAAMPLLSYPPSPGTPNTTLEVSAHESADPSGGHQEQQLVDRNIEWLYVAVCPGQDERPLDDGHRDEGGGAAAGRREPGPGQ